MPKMTVAIVVAVMTLTTIPAKADGMDGPKKRLIRAEAAEVEVVAGPSSLAYRFGPVNVPPVAVPIWGYLFGNGYARSPTFNYYAPGYRPPSATGAPPVGRYYATPCYNEPQQIWNGTNWVVSHIRICR